MTNDTPELLPCPFCGGEARHFVDHTTEQCDEILCQSCCAVLSDFHLDGPQGACVAAWNTRDTRQRDEAVGAACADVLAKAALELPNDEYRQARIRSIEAPSDATTALAARDAETWNAAIEAAAKLMAKGLYLSAAEDAEDIRTLRKEAPNAD